MNINYDNISDDEIRIIVDGQEKRKRPRLLYLLIVAGVLFLGAVILWLSLSKPAQPTNDAPDGYFEPVEATDTLAVPDDSVLTPLSLVNDSLVTKGFCEVLDTTINDVPLQIFIPHRAKAKLHIGRVSEKDKSIIYVAQAADIYADSKKILGAFVLAGKPMAWGLSKKGYCAIINDSVTVGVSENSPLFEEATEKGGYFFRQYPLVKNGRLVENEPKNKALRRAICQRRGETFMVHSVDKESLHDFSQALVDLHVENAVYLVGSVAHGWCIDDAKKRIEWGEPIGRRFPPNTSYIIWRRK